jgi:hypothetical protein
VWVAHMNIVWAYAIIIDYQGNEEISRGKVAVWLTWDAEYISYMNRLSLYHLS